MKFIRTCIEEGEEKGSSKPCDLLPAMPGIAGVQCIQKAQVEDCEFERVCQLADGRFYESDEHVLLRGIYMGEMNLIKEHKKMVSDSLAEICGFASGLVGEEENGDCNEDGRKPSKAVSEG